MNIPAISFDKGHSGTVESKVVYGRLVKLDTETSASTNKVLHTMALVRDVDGNYHAGVVECDLWMLAWKMGLGSDKASQDFARLPEEKQNDMLRGSNLRPAFFRFYGNALIGGYTLSYRDINAEDLEPTLRKALPDCVTKTEIKSNGIHGGVLRAVERKPYDNFTGFVKVDCGSKDGRTPLRGWAGGFFGNREILFQVTNPKLKSWVRQRKLHKRDPAYLKLFTIPHVGNPHKSLLKFARDYAIRNEYVDSLCDKLKDKIVSAEDHKRLFGAYQGKAGLSARTILLLHKWKFDHYNRDITYLELCYWLHDVSRLNIAPSQQTVLRNMSSDLLVLGDYFDEVMEVLT